MNCDSHIVLFFHLLLGTSFTVQWENVILQEKSEKGGFTFQCTLFNNGDIVFVYQQVPVVIEDIKDDNHPVKIGLSDAYIIDRTIFCELKLDNLIPSDFSVYVKF